MALGDLSAGAGRGGWQDRCPWAAPGAEMVEEQIEHDRGQGSGADPGALTAVCAQAGKPA
ncbi:hypothetical protein Sgleb_14980 [Streptomyces glebosus]|uniref:Uncharacterized protein n=1 Tax=Streptomyces glebosus TaxID=249580 RepID=A0A640ST59_9ACTN|nr:hypothetical protein Sgleb_14980 [Streptomyces glebosus]GHG90949.1 hypothetical protein GCM10010513_74310 [Streptomyces glebosus]